MLPAGHQRAVVAPDHAAQGMERGVGAHQGQATGPVEVDLEGIADGRRVALGRLELVDDLAVDLARALDRPGPAIRRAQEQPPIGRLAAPARIEDRAIQDDQGGLAGLDVTDRRRGVSGVGVGVAELLAGRRHRRAQLAVMVPTMFGWTDAQERVLAGAAGRDLVRLRRHAVEDLALELERAGHVLDLDVVRDVRVVVGEGRAGRPCPPGRSAAPGRTGCRWPPGRRPGRCHRSGPRSARRSAPRWRRRWGRHWHRPRRSGRGSRTGQAHRSSPACWRRRRPAAGRRGPRTSGRADRIGGVTASRWVAEDRGRDVGRNLPRPAVRREGRMRSPGGTAGPGPPVPKGRLWAAPINRSLAIHLPASIVFGAQRTMLKHYAERAWRLAITVGPLVAIALTLVAGQKWR